MGKGVHLHLKGIFLKKISSDGSGIENTILFQNWAWIKMAQYFRDPYFGSSLS